MKITNRVIVFEWSKNCHFNRKDTDLVQKQDSKEEFYWHHKSFYDVKNHIIKSEKG